MGRNRVFFSHEALDAWIVTGAVELQDRDLVIRDEGRRYRLSEGVRVLAEVTGEADSFDIVGRCKTMGFLSELGADLLERSMIIDNHAYDVVQGFLGVPIPNLVPPTASSAPGVLTIGSPNTEAPTLDSSTPDSSPFRASTTEDPTTEESNPEPSTRDSMLSDMDLLARFLSKNM